MHAIGPVTPWIEYLKQDQQDSWTLQSGDMLDISVTFIQAQKQFMLSALLGQPDERYQQAVYTTMLCMNLLYAEEHSSRIALTRPGGELMLLSEATPEDWTIAGLQQLLVDFCQRASRLIEEIVEIAHEDEIPEFFDRDFCRV
jgi:hypothetical protein